MHLHVFGGVRFLLWSCMSALYVGGRVLWHMSIVEIQKSNGKGVWAECGFLQSWRGGWHCDVCGELVELCGQGQALYSGCQGQGNGNMGHLEIAASRKSRVWHACRLVD